jgi:ABC-type amino acid transport substrate-binding protein
VRRGEAGRYATADAVKGAMGGIGFLKATSAGSVVRREFKSGKAIPLSSPDDAVFHLVNQRIDLYIDDLAAAVDLVARNETRLEIVPVPLHEQELAWAVRPDNPELLQQANDALARWRASGWLDETLNRWMPYRRGLPAAAE